MKPTVTYIQAYKSMFFFLDTVYKTIHKGDDLGTLLSSLMFVEDQNQISTSDPASWYDWLDSLYKAFPELKDSTEGQLTYFQSFKTMYRFLCEYRTATESKEIGLILEKLLYTASGDEGTENQYNASIWQRWLDSIQKALHATSSAG